MGAQKNNLEGGRGRKKEVKRNIWATETVLCVCENERETERKKMNF